VALSTREEFLNNLYRMKRDCIAFMEEAERAATVARPASSRSTWSESNP
jgi:hypothetical protein